MFKISDLSASTVFGKKKEMGRKPTGVPPSSIWRLHQKKSVLMFVCSYRFLCFPYASPHPSALSLKGGDWGKKSNADFFLKKKELGVVVAKEKKGEKEAGQ